MIGNVGVLLYSYHLQFTYKQSQVWNKVNGFTNPHPHLEYKMYYSAYHLAKNIYIMFKITIILVLHELNRKNVYSVVGVGNFKFFGIAIYKTPGCF